MTDELFEIVDEAGRVKGLAPRSRCHGDPSLIHQVVHVLVFDRLGQLFLQKRSLLKDVQPGKWDTSVGGHMHPGEQPKDAAAREMAEELGVQPGKLEFAYQYLWRSPVESELVRTFVALHEGPFVLDRGEIEEGRFWSLADIESSLAEGYFTPQFVHEFPRMRDWRERKSSSMTHFTR